LLAVRGGLTVAEAVQLVRVSPATVRRDFDAMAARGLGVRVHGGIVDPLLESWREIREETLDEVGPTWHARSRGTDGERRRWSLA
jgi:DeoR/GlpR family transcriptional regulator of sugar metabolism